MAFFITTDKDLKIRLSGSRGEHGNAYRLSFCTSEGERTITHHSKRRNARVFNLYSALYCKHAPAILAAIERKTKDRTDRLSDSIRDGF